MTIVGLTGIFAGHLDQQRLACSVTAHVQASSPPRAPSLPLAQSASSSPPELRSQCPTRGREDRAAIIPSARPVRQ